MDKTAIIIANLTAGSASKRAVSVAVEALKRIGLKPHLRPTLHAGHAEELAREAVSESPAMIIAAGGDGTINEAINAMASSRVPLAVIPLGTANVLALAAGIPLSADKAIEHALRIRKPRQIRLGTIEADGRKRHFCLMAGIGFDAETVRTLNLHLKRRTGKLAYIASSMRVLGSWKPEQLEVSIDGTHHRCHHLIVCKAQKYAGRFTIAPKARFEESEFQVVMVEQPGRTPIVKFAIGMLIGGFIGSHGLGARTVGGRVLEVKGAAPVQLDGDFFGYAPARIRADEAWIELLY